MTERQIDPYFLALPADRPLYDSKAVRLSDFENVKDSLLEDGWEYHIVPQEKMVYFRKYIRGDREKYADLVFVDDRYIPIEPPRKKVPADHWTGKNQTVEAENYVRNE